MTLPTKKEIYEELCRRHGTDVQKKLANARVAIAGLGGLGSTITIDLVRAGQEQQVHVTPSARPRPRAQNRSLQR